MPSRQAYVRAMRKILGNSILATCLGVADSVERNFKLEAVQDAELNDANAIGAGFP